LIELYTAPTPNGWKVSVMLEECGLAYQTRWVNIGAGEQFAQDFVAISPNGRIPAIIDTDPGDGGTAVPVFETAAILVYLAEKTGRFLPTDLRGRTQVLEWLAWQVAGLGPMLGQHGHFALYAPERIAYATDRYRREALRLYGVLDKRPTSTPSPIWRAFRGFRRGRRNPSRWLISPRSTPGTSG
jgi:GST-like protein